MIVPDIFSSTLFPIDPIRPVLAPVLANLVPLLALEDKESLSFTTSFFLCILPGGEKDMG
jgi:hypothetical protein